MFKGSNRRFGVTTNISGLSHGIVVNNISFSDSLDSAEARDHNGNIIDIAVYGENEQVSIDGVYVGDGVEAGTIIKVDDKNFLVTSTGRNEVNTAFQTASVNARYYPGQEPPIPPGPEPPVYQPLTFKAVGSGSTKIKIGQVGHPSAITLNYKLNDGDWTPYTIEDMINLNQNDTIAFSGANDHFSNNVGNYFFYADNGPIEASGNIMSLMNFSDTCTPYCFRSLFKYFSPLTSAPQLPATTLANSCYSEMFYNCQYLTSAPQLPATTLADWCYANMFQNCLALTAAPELPATELADHCYYRMFYNCQNLSTAPSILPATSLAYNCYEGMFNTCLALTSAPILPATGLVGECYQYMFYQCRNLSSINVDFTDWNVPNATYYWVTAVAPTGIFYKPSTLSAEYDDSRIPWDWQVVNKEDLIPLTFKSTNGIGGVALNQYGSPQEIDIQYNKNNVGWTNYTLGQTIILNQNETVAFSGANDHFSQNNNFYYFSMGGQIEASGNIMSLMNFSDSCTNYCFYGMFEGCSGLLTAPQLPATTLADNCYKSTFLGCTSLTAAPQLPATTLKTSCYSNMFNSCSALTDAPYLPAKTLAIDCYNYMFANCSSLSSINVEFTSWNVINSTNNWVQNVATSGIFTKPSGLSEEYGDSRIPTNWREQEPVVDNPLTFEAYDDGVKLGVFGSQNPPNVDLSYKKNNGDWNTFNINDTIFLNAGDKVSFSGNNPSGLNHGTASYIRFVGATQLPQHVGKLKVYGNIMSLLTSNYSNVTDFNFMTNPTDVFNLLFNNNTCLYDASELILPATTLATTCYGQMFVNCSNLTAAPQLPATGLAVGCYWGMFQNCSNLTAAPQLPATGLASYCYEQMFSSCTSLTDAPQLPATTLAEHCYQFMFNECSSLIEAPQLPATGLAIACYYRMFQNCSNLTAAPQLPATGLANGCYQGMFNYCTSLTSAPQLPATTLANECYMNMFRNCTSITFGPQLSATVLAPYCYNSMFKGCSSMLSIPAIFATTLYESCMDNMFDGCSRLTYLNVNFTSWSNYVIFTNNWVQNVAANGIFYKPAALNEEYGQNRIPTNWRVVNKDQPIETSLNFKAVNSSGAVRLSHNGSPDSITLEYSKNNGAWTTYNIGDTILLDQDDVVYLSGNNNHFSKSYSDYYYFVMTGSIEAGGNTMSLMNFSDSLTNYGFAYLFFHCNTLLTAPALPATTLAINCYRDMFAFCSSLSAAPQLPATTLTSQCYDMMFYACDILSSINVNFTEWGNNGSWVQSVGANGVFYKPSALSQQYGINYIPSGWTVINK